MLYFLYVVHLIVFYSFYFELYLVYIYYDTIDKNNIFNIYVLTKTSDIMKYREYKLRIYTIIWEVNFCNGTLTLKVRAVNIVYTLNE